MEASVRKKSIDLSDPRWTFGAIITFTGILLTILIILWNVRNKLSAMEAKVAIFTECKTQIDKINKEYVPVEQLVNVVDLLQTENQELIGISRGNTAQVKEATDRYHNLILQWERDMRHMRGGVMNNEKLAK